MRTYLLWILIAAIFTTSSCLKGNNDSYTCTYDPCQLKAPDSQVVKIETYLNTNGITAVKHCSGLYYTMVSPGTGDLSPTPCSAIAINYTGTLTNGNVFDKSTAPVSFSLMSLISGWKNGIPLMKKGGKIRLYIPPSLGYGPSANGSIPGNSILIFDVELLDFQ